MSEESSTKVTLRLFNLNPFRGKDGKQHHDFKANATKEVERSEFEDVFVLHYLNAKWDTDVLYVRLNYDSTLPFIDYYQMSDSNQKRIDEESRELTFK